ncbi:MAG: YraN family protein [Anaerolineales bacterium]|nr:YraN family protein [Anaerolineales bacterium]MCS7248561.1 YraN family protein [Anaerolineales bacterium]MDW8162374.1 YraN family protein [Anaerolineales bacterium]MDW8447402.1 YraN family protein [Anaerolineales bacterium]
MKPFSARALGHCGEDIAARYLEAKGYRILERNYATRYGEIDLVALCCLSEEGGRLVFVEVKTRRNQRCGYPEESITPKKLNHLILACQEYLQSHQKEEVDWQIDVVAIELSPGSPVQVTHLENVTLP